MLVLGLLGLRVLVLVLERVLLVVRLVLLVLGLLLVLLLGMMVRLLVVLLPASQLVWGLLLWGDRRQRVVRMRGGADREGKGGRAWASACRAGQATAAAVAVAVARRDGLR